MLIHELLDFAAKSGASDIHISAGAIPALRIDGEIRKLDHPPLTPEEAKRIAYSIMNEKQKTIFENELELDFSIGLKGLARFRINAFNQVNGVGMVLRFIPEETWTLQRLNGPAVLQQLADLPRGLVLVTGPTGSGKSSTLAAMIDYINSNKNKI